MDHSAAPGLQSKQQVEVTFAGFWVRFFAYIIDTVFMSLVGLIVALSAGIVGNLENLEIVNLTSYVVGLLTPFYYVCFWALQGATPGKIMLGMRIVGPNGSINGIGWWRAILRFFGYFLSTFLLYLGYIWIAIDRDKQGWHDKIAGTRVINL